MLTHSFPTRRSSDWLFETLTYQQLVLLSQTLDVAFRTRVTDLVLLVLERLRKRTIVRGVGLELGGRGVEPGFDAFHACASCGDSDNSSASRSNVCPLSTLTVAITPSRGAAIVVRSEAHTSGLHTLMRISSADFCLKKTTHKHKVLNL